MLLTHWLSSLMGRGRFQQRSSRRLSRNRRLTLPPAVEWLENRTLLTGSVDLVFDTATQTGLLMIDATENADAVSVAEDGEHVTVTLNGQSIAFDTNSIQRIVFHGYAGDDFFHNQTSIASAAYGNEGNDTLWGEDGNDEFFGGSGNDGLDGRGGDDVLWGGDGNDGLFGGDGNDVLFGEGDTDFLYGGLGHDFLDAGGAEYDELFGGEGFDLLNGGGGPDVLDDGSQEGVHVFAGTGLLMIGGTENADVASVSANGQQVTVTLNGQSSAFDTNSVQGIVFHGFAGDDFFHNQTSIASTAYGNEGNDTLWGEDGNDEFFGGSGNDGLDGNGGDDVLWGGDGNDGLFGGDGNDVLSGEADTDFLFGGAGHDSLDGGGAEYDELFGGAGFDLLNGGGGPDVLDDGSQEAAHIFAGTSLLMIGGTERDDTVSVSADGQQVTVTLNGQSTAFDINSVQGIEFHGYAGDDFFHNQTSIASTAYGNEGNDTLWGEDGNDEFFGGSGNDGLDGNGGDDVLWGGDGNDGLFGGDGNDVLYGEGDTDFLYGGGGNDSLDGGGAEYDELFGGEGLDLLDGGGGPDVLDDGSLAGAHVFAGTSLLLIGGTEGDDTVSVSADGQEVTVTLNGQSIAFDINSVERIEFHGYAGDDFFHNQTSIASTAYGGEGNDSLWGEDGNDEFFGGSGNDGLDGNGGDDVLWGGDGNDGLFGGDGNDVLSGEADTDFLFGGGGHDFLYGGGAEYDELLGGEGIDTLDGGGGPDVIDYGWQYGVFLNSQTGELAIGGADDQNNVAVVRDSTDPMQVLVALDGQEHVFDATSVHVISFLGYSGDDTFDNQTSVASTADGGAGIDTLFGGSGQDVFYGGSGNDGLDGRGGDDTLWGGNGNDGLFGGDGNDVLYGEADTDFLFGGAGHDVLDGGGAEYDELFGGEGFDLLNGGGGPDVLDHGSQEAAHIFAGTSLLMIGGTENADVTSVSTGGQHVTVSLNGQSTVFDTNSVQRIIFQGYAGDDFFHNQTSIASTAHGGEGNDTLWGEDGNDEFIGGSGDDGLDGRGGDDTLWGGDGTDQLFGGDGNDVLLGEGEIDFLFGGKGSDLLSGGGGDDELYGGLKEDILLGGSGHDKLDGGSAADVMIGGADSDDLHTDSDRDRAVLESLDTVFFPGGSVLSAVDVIGSVPGFGISEPPPPPPPPPPEDDSEPIQDPASIAGFNIHGEPEPPPEDDSEPILEPIPIAGYNLYLENAALVNLLNPFHWAIHDPSDSKALFYDDVRQGQSPTCTFAAALAAVARTDFDLASGIQFQGLDFEGNYRFLVRLFAAGSAKWISVVYNGTKSMNRDDIRLADRLENQGPPIEFWGTLYQRAYLQEFAGVDLAGGEAMLVGPAEWQTLPVALRAITGLAAQHYNPTAASVDQSRIADALAAGKAVTGGTHDETGNIVLDPATGLIADHAYSIVGIEIAASGLYLVPSETHVILRNPWGYDTTWGLMGNYDDGWSAGDHFEGASTDGVFFDGLVRVNWSDFVEHFGEYTIGDVAPGNTVNLIGDYLGTGDNALFVVGDGEANTITIIDGSVVVFMNGVEVGHFDTTEVDRIIVHGDDGDDIIEVDAEVTIPLRVYGGSGNDVIRGGGGSNELIGEDGNDVLIGGAGANVLDGLEGDDVLQDGGGVNLVIGGSGDNVFVDGGGSSTFVATAGSQEPEVFADAYQLDEDAVLDVTSDLGVLANDVDPLVGTLVATLVNGPSHGAVSLQGDGSFSYTPDANFSGSDGFTYVATNGTAHSSETTVTLLVTPVADSPMLTLENVLGEEGTPIPLSITSELVDADGSELFSISISGLPEGAVLSAGTNEGSGNWSLTRDDLTTLTVTVPDDAFFSAEITATAIELANGHSVSTSGTFEVTSNNVAPVVTNLSVDVAVVNEDGSVTVSGSFTDVGTQDTHTVVIDWGAGETSSAAMVTQGAGSGTFTATHQYKDDNPTGTASDAYTITATVTDDDGLYATATTSVTVNNVAPVVDGFVETHRFQAPADLPGDLTFDGTHLFTSNLNDFRTIFQLDTDGTVVHSFLAPSTFDPQGAFDGRGNPEGLAFDGTHLFVANPEADFTGTIFKIDPAGTTIVDKFSTPFRPAVMTYDGMNLFTAHSDTDEVSVYTPAGAFVRTFGTPDRLAGLTFDEQSGHLFGMGGIAFPQTIFEFTTDGTLVDTFSTPGTGPMTLAGSKMYLAEVAEATIIELASLATARVDQTVNEGDLVTLEGSFVDPGSNDTHTFLWQIAADNGQVIADGTAEDFSFTPYDNGLYTVTFTVTDDDGGVGSDTVVITVNNVAPVAGDDTAATVEDQTVLISVLANDSDIAGSADPLQITSVGSPGHGTAVVDDNGTPLDTSDDRIRYTPNPGFEGSDSFSYSIGDGDGGTATAMVSVDIQNLVDLAGRVFDDLNNDGLFNGSDSGLENVTVALYDESDLSTLIAVETSDSNGDYVFDVNLLPGSYRIVETQPALLLDGRETAGSLGGTVDNTQDSHSITGIVVVSGDADATGYAFAEIKPSEAMGLVWQDFNNDGEVNFGEQAIENVTLDLSGTDDRGNAVSQQMQTDADGIYMFVDLRPGDYTISQVQPSDLNDGLDVVGTVNGVATGDNSVDDTISGVVLTLPGSVAANYNFGERPADGGGVVTSQAAGIGFWQNNNGQSLIESLNGGASSTQLGDWLAATFPNMYGASAGANDLTGFTNTQVAEFYSDLFRRKKKDAVYLGGPVKTDTQVLATALAVYVTNSTLAGTIAESYGFVVTEHGIGTSTFNVGDNGDAFDVADGSEVTILDLLLATNAKSAGGILYDLDSDGDADDSLETLFRTMANDVYSAINEIGDN